MLYLARPLLSELPQVAREPANLATDLIVISDAFVVVVVGGMGSITGAYLAAVLIAEVKALCIALGVVHFAGLSVNFSKMTLVAEFLVKVIYRDTREDGAILVVWIAICAGVVQPIRRCCSGALGQLDYLDQRGLGRRLHPRL